MEKHVFVTKEEAIKKIQELPDNAVFVLTFDFDKGNGISDCGKYIDKPHGEKLIGEAVTRVFSGNEYMSQINLYNILQTDIKNIKPEGLMKTILLRGLKKNGD